MPRLILAILAIAIVVFGALKLAGFIDTPDRSKVLQTLVEDYYKRRDQAVQAFENATNKLDKRAAADRLPNRREYVDKALIIAEANPKDQTAFSALAFALALTDGSDERVLNLLAEHHAGNPEIKNACRYGVQLAYQGKMNPGFIHLLKTVVEQCPDKEAQGLACISLANVAAEQGDKGDAAANSDAEKYAERTLRDFPTIQLDAEHTTGDMAKMILNAIRNLQVGRTPPDFESQDLKGAKVHLADHRGKVVVLDVWATWCGPCKEMIPHERSLVRKLKDEPLAFISISADDKSDDVVKFVEKEPMPWVHWWVGPKGKFHEDWNITHYPTIYVLDAKGVIRYKEVRGADLEKAVETLLSEMKK